MLKLVHSADWHLGRRFRSFPEDGALKLSRARLEVVDRILQVAERLCADAVLCAGDLFDEPNPPAEWWRQVAEKLGKAATNRPIFLLPGNHDPLIPESIWVKGHPFRAALPPWAHVVDHAKFEFTLPNGAVLYAVPCLSKAGAQDPTLAIPLRAAGDDRIRIGMVHGSTFDAKDWQTNFPIHPDAAVERGLDYLAIGDTHGFRYVPPDRMHPPTIYPGAPEPTAFDERGAGNVAAVFVSRTRRVTVRQERVARWTWEEHNIGSLAELRTLVRRPDLPERVLRLRISMRVSAPEYDEAERLIEELGGTPARHARAGVLDLDRSGLQLDTASVELHCADLPDVLRATALRLRRAAEVADATQRAAAERALFHLYRSSKAQAS